MTDEPLGTCDTSEMGRQEPHPKQQNCKNWRESPQAEPTPEADFCVCDYRPRRKCTVHPGVPLEAGEKPHVTREWDKDWNPICEPDCPACASSPPAQAAAIHTVGFKPIVSELDGIVPNKRKEATSAPHGLAPSEKGIGYEQESERMGPANVANPTDYPEKRSCVVGPSNSETVGGAQSMVLSRRFNVRVLSANTLARGEAMTPEMLERARAQEFEKFAVDFTDVFGGFPRADAIALLKQHQAELWQAAVREAVRDIRDELTVMSECDYAKAHWPYKQACSEMLAALRQKFGVAE